MNFPLGGMARAGLGTGWTSAFASDFNPVKAQGYRAKGDCELKRCDVAQIAVSELPGIADLALASLPCHHRSLAGDGREIGVAASAAALSGRSGRLCRSLQASAGHHA